MRVFSTIMLICFIFFGGLNLHAQNWIWTPSAKPDINSGLYGISMLSDGLAGWAVGSDREIGRIFHTSDGWQTWTEQTDTNVSRSKLSDVCFVDEMNGWVTGYNGIILHTSDGGANWEIQGEGVTTVRLRDVSAVDEHHAFACGSDGVIVKTNDGINWSVVDVGTNSQFYSIDMYDATHGIAVGKSETIFYTTDGISWNSATTPPRIGGKDFNAVCMLDQNTAWLVGDGFSFLALKSVFAKTIDGGNSWTLWEPAEMIMENMWAIDFTSATQGVAVGDKGWVFVTTDGNNWEPLPRQFGDKISAVANVGDQIWASNGNGILYYSENFDSNWTHLTDINGTNLYKLSVVTNDRIIAVGYASSILKTEDGGANWKSGSVVANNDISQQLWGIDFATPDIGWVAGSGGFIAKTSDGANSWTLQGEGLTNEWLRHIYAYDENEVWVVGKKGVILKSNNGGDHWDFQAAGITGNNLNGIDGLDQNRLAIIGEKSTFLYSDNGGQTWEQSSHDLGGEKKINALDVIDENHAWAVGADGLILFSPDAGKNWTNQASPTMSDLDGVRFKDESTGWVVGDDGVIFETTDGGTNWAPVAVGITNKYLKSVDMTDDGKVFACGYGGTVVRYGPGPVAISLKNSPSAPGKFRLGQNYPNPFNPTTTIDYELAKTCHVNIAIYNTRGQRVVTLVQGTKPAGAFQASWNATSNTSGVYFIKMTAEDFSTVRKVLLVK